MSYCLFLPKEKLGRNKQQIYGFYDVVLDVSPSPMKIQTNCLSNCNIKPIILQKHTTYVGS